MNGQRALFGSPSGVPSTVPVRSHRASDPETSRLAAVHALPRMATNRWIVLRALVDAGAAGLDDFALERATGIKQTSCGKRRGELRDLGLVEMLVVDGKPVRRRAPSGALCQVWCATPAGVETVWAEGL